MNACRITLSATLLLGLTACATTPRPTPAQIGQTLLSGRVVVSPIPTPIRLSEKTKAQAIGNVVATSMLGSALGGGHVEASKVFAETAAHALPDSYRIAAGAGADLALAKRFSDYFSAGSPGSGMSDGHYLLTVKAEKWELGYVSFLASQDYALSYLLRVRVEEIRGGKRSRIAQYDCHNLGRESEQATKLPYETWRAGGYKALDEEAEKIVGECYQQGLRELGLG